MAAGAGEGCMMVKFVYWFIGKNYFFAFHIKQLQMVLLLNYFTKNYFNSDKLKSSFLIFACLLETILY